jgi:5'-nucleotidase
MIKQLSPILLLLLFLSVWQQPIAYANAKILPIKLIAINDFHGQLPTNHTVTGLAIGGAATLAAYIKPIEHKNPNRTIICLIGDMVGASPAVSNLLNDKPTVAFFNSLANKQCTYRNRLNPYCNMVATIGNHEFDHGLESLQQLWNLQKQDSGALFPIISANIIDQNQRYLFPPYVIKTIQGIKIAFIGAITRYAPQLILGQNRPHLQFIPEATAINRLIPIVKAQGARIIVVMIHEGGQQTPYAGTTKQATTVTGPIVQIVKNLNSQVDLVLAGHTHQFLNAYIKNRAGKNILVTEANSYSTAFADISLLVNTKTKKLTKVYAQIITTLHHIPEDLATKQLVANADNQTAKQRLQIIGHATTRLTKQTNRAGESMLGDFIADAYRATMHSDFALVNSGGLRTSLKPGIIQWQDLFAITPFHNRLLLMKIKGSDLYTILEQQFSKSHAAVLQISGFEYQYAKHKGPNAHIIAIYQQGHLINKSHDYTLATNDYLAKAGDGFHHFNHLSATSYGPDDIDGLVSYIQHLKSPIHAMTKRRIKRLD